MIASSSLRATILAILVVTTTGCSDSAAPEPTTPNSHYAGNWDTYVDGLELQFWLDAAQCDARRCNGVVWYTYTYRAITADRRTHAGTYHVTRSSPAGATLADQAVEFAFTDPYSDRLALYDVSLQVTINVAPVGNDTLAGTIRINAITASGQRVATTSGIELLRRLR